MRIKRTIRVLVLLNAVFWAIGFFFPFSRFLAVEEMRRLAYWFAGVGMSFPVILMLFAISALWVNRNALAQVRYDIVLAGVATSLDIFLMYKV